MNRFLRFSFSRLNPSVFLAGFLFFMLPGLGWGQGTIILYNFDGNINANTGSSISSFTDGSGVLTYYAGKSGDAVSMSNSSGNNTKYFQISANTTGKKDIKIDFWRQRSSSGAQTISLQYSTTGASGSYTVGTIVTVPTTGADASQIDLSSITALNNNSQVVFRLYVSGASGTGTFRLDDFKITATDSGPTVSKPAISAPTSTSISTTSATLGATIDSNGGETITASGIAYSATNSSPTTPISNTSGPIASGAFTVNITGLNSNTKYFYRGFATNPTGGTGYTGDNVFFITLPDAPVADVPSIIGVNSFVASWSDVSGSEVETYLVDVATDNTFASGNILTNGSVGAVNSFNVTGLTAGTTYYVRVRAQNTAGLSAYSNVVSVTTNTTASAPTVSNLAVSGITYSSATLEAEVLNSGGATVTARGFYYGTVANPTGNDTPVGSGLGVFNTPLSGLLPNTLYYYRAYATNAAGTDLTSDGSFITATNAPLATTATSILSSGFTANWNSVTGAVSYFLDVSTSNSFATYVTGFQNLTVSSTSQAVFGLNPGTTYYYRVRASNGTISENSNVISTLTLPNAPTATAATSIGPFGFTANWNILAGVTGYKLDVASDNTFSAMVPGYNDLAVGTNSLSISGLAANTTYFYRVRALNSAGTSANSNIISTTTSGTTGITLINWDFADNNLIADGGITANLSKALSKVGPTGTISVSGNAAVNGWDNGVVTDKYWLIEFNTIGYESIKLSSKQRSSGTGPRDFKIQYQVGSTSGTWIDVPGGTVTVADNYSTGAVSNLPLPVGTVDEPIVYIRWKVTSTTSVSNGTVGGGGNSNIDDIIVTGDVFSSSPYIVDAALNGSGLFCAGSGIEVTFIAKGTFNAVAGNKFQVELSDGSGSFTTPVIIGLGNSSPITTTLPAGLSSGNGYKVRVAGLDPVVYSPESSSVSINAIPGSNIPSISPTTTQIITTNSTGTAITASAPNTSTFSWKIGTVSGSYTSTISGATSATYSPKGTDFGTPGTYYLVTVATSTCGAVEGISPEVIIEVLPSASLNSKAEAVASSEAVTISSLQNTVAINSNADGVQVWQVKLYDGDGANDDADGLPTQYSGFTFTKGASNTVSDWAATILGLQFFEDNNTTPIAGSITVSASNIVFTPTTPIQVTDGAGNYKTLSLRLSLKNPLPALSDNKIFQFSLTKANITTGSQTTSSQLQTAAFTLNSSGTSNKIAVAGTTLKFIQQPSNVITLTNMSPAVTLEFVDANGNRDLDGSVSITASGAVLTGSPVTATANAGTGIFSFGSLQFSTYGNNVTIAGAIGTSNVTSSAFTVNAGNEQYSYRSARSGSWTNVAAGSETWERSIDGATWMPVSLATELPNASSGPISIGNGHEVTLNSSVTADQVTVIAGGTLTVLINNTLTIADGTGTDLTVNGTVKNAGTIVQNTGSTAAFNANSTYDHAILAGFGVIPVATWNSTSTVKITGHSGSGGAAGTANYDQIFGNFQWNATGQPTSVNLLGQLRNVAGNLEILSSNAKELRLSNGTASTLNIGGDFNVGSNVILNLNSQTGSGTFAINLAGNLVVNGGTIMNENTSSATIFTFTGSNKSFTNTGTVTGTNINWIVSSAGKLTLASDIFVATGRTLTVNGQLFTQDKLVKGAGSFNLTSTGTLGIGSAQGITTSGANGSVQVSGTRTFNANATYIYNGSAAQNTGSGLPVSGIKLTLNNLAGLTLMNATEVSELILTQGTLTSGNTNKLTISAAGTLTVVGSDSHINGPLARKLAFPGIINFPIGKGGKKRFLTLEIMSQEAGEVTYTAEQFESAYATTATLPASVTHISNVRYFTITKSGAAPVSARITMTYATDDKVTASDKLTIVKYNASGAEDLNATAATSDLEGTITSDYFTSFSDFVLGNKVGGNNPLPVELISFSARPTGKTVLLNWATATEKNSHNFEIQRSADGRNFEAVGLVKAHGNSSVQNRYAFEDKNPLTAISYYRLKQSDLDGTFVYSATEQVALAAATNVRVQVYPNPTAGNLNISLPTNETAYLRIINMLGQEVLNQPLNGSGQTELNLEALPAGTYQVVVTSQNYRAVQKLFKVNR